MAQIRNVQTLTKTNIENGNITFADAEILIRFVEKRKEINKVKSESREVMITSTLCNLRGHGLLPEFGGKITTDAIFKCLNGMPKFYKQNTCRENWNILKTFLKWGTKNNLFTVDWEQLNEYQPPEINKESVKASDILTDADINRMIDAAQTARDKAIIVVLAETGCRPKELTTLLWSDVTFTGRSVQFSLIDAKKPSVRKNAFVTKRVSYIVDLQKSQASDTAGMNVFRQTVNGNSTIIGGKNLQTPGISYIVKTVAGRAGVKLPAGASVKIFRASSVTNKLKSRVPPVAIMDSHWSAGAGSKMFDHYKKLAGSDIEDMLLSVEGQPVDNRPVKVDAAAVGWICVRDGHQNPAGAKFCQECGRKPDQTENQTEKEKALEEKLAAMEAKYNRIIAMLEKQ